MPAVDDAWLEELVSFLSIPSVSADAAHDDDVDRAAEWLRDFVNRAGGVAEVDQRGPRPLVIGEIPSSNGHKAPTVLLYGHFDVQPPAPLDEWETPPFEPTVRDGWLYGRGAADDKGNLYLLLKAAEQLAAEGALPVNVRIACDGEEEVGGSTIVDFVTADEGPADACVIFDAHMPARGRPAFYIATRGLVYLHVRVRTGTRDLHSGLYGGVALNAMHALVEILSAVVPRDGRVPEPLRAGIVPPTEAELADWAKLTPGAAELESQGARPADVRAAADFYVRTWAEPSVDIHGVGGGSPQLTKTVLPVAAEGNLSIRLAPGQSTARIGPVLEQLLRAAAPEGAEVEIESRSSAEPGLVPPESTAIQLGLDAFERAVGVRPLLLRSGGSLPVVAALSKRGIPTVVTGFDLPEGNIHSPNERFLLEHIPLGVRAARELLLAYGDL